MVKIGVQTGIVGGEWGWRSSAEHGFRTDVDRAYRDTAMIPAHIVKALVAVATKHTGYTHQWRVNEWLKPFVMASSDSARDYANATAQGWRTFRVSTDARGLDGEIMCLADARGITCEKCGLCAGTSKGANVKNIFIQVYGAGASNFKILQ